MDLKLHLYRREDERFLILLLAARFYLNRYNEIIDQEKTRFKILILQCLQFFNVMTMLSPI